MNIELTPIVTAAASVAVALITGIVTVLTMRGKAKADLQTTFTSNMASFTDDMREQLAEERKRTDYERDRAERWRDRADKAEDENRYLRGVIYKAGLIVPSPPGLSAVDEPGSRELVGSDLTEALAAARSSSIP